MIYNNNNNNNNNNDCILKKLIAATYRGWITELFTKYIILKYNIIDLINTRKNDYFKLLIKYNI